MKSTAKFFRGRTATSEIVELEVVGGLLQISKDGQVLASWPVQHVFRDPSYSVAVVLGCSGDDERLELLDSGILRDLPIDGHIWNREGIQKKKNLLIAGVAINIVAIFAFIWFTPQIAKRLAFKVPLEYEKKLGTLALEGSKLEVCELTPEQRKVADQLMLKLAPNDSIKSELNFVARDDVNAYTFPGGDIYVFKGLLEKAGSSDELAGVLAHELEHVKERHVMQAVVKAAMFTGLLNFVLGDFSSILLVDPATAAQLLSLKHSRTMEEEADEGALQRLNRAQISSKGMADFFGKLEDKEISKALSFISTHPFSGDRAKRFRKAITTESERDSNLALTSGEWLQILKVCEAGTSQ